MDAQLNFLPVSSFADLIQKAAFIAINGTNDPLLKNTNGDDLISVGELQIGID